MIYTDLIADVDFLVDTDSVIYPIIDKTRNFNLALDEVTGVIIGCDGTWQWDDSNYTDLPIGMTGLVVNQQDYSFADEHLAIEALEIKDATGAWKRLKPINLYPEYNEALRGSITSFMSTAGTPEYYDKVGDSIFLYPTPNYTQVNSLKAFFQRKAQPFVVSNTTKQAGFANHLHRYLSICVAYDWAVAKQHSKMNFLLNEKERYKKMIMDFYTKRIKDETKRLRPAYQNNR
jgi:hypothetical protein